MQTFRQAARVATQVCDAMGATEATIGVGPFPEPLSFAHRIALDAFVADAKAQGMDVQQIEGAGEASATVCLVNRGV